MSAKPGLVAGDLVFLCLLVLAWAAVGLSGSFAYQQGARLESAKDNGQSFLRWTESLSAHLQKGQPLAPDVCTAAAVPTSDAPSTDSADRLSWALCRQVLLGQGGALSGLVNPFNSQHPVLGAKCERKQPSARGIVVVEKGTPSAPGLPPSTAWAPLPDEEPLQRGLMLRVQVCDGGGYPIRIAEVTL